MRRTTVVVVLILLVQSCIDLKNIHSFATTSGSTLESVSDNEYSFTSSFLKYNISEQFFNLSIEETRDNKFKLPVVAIDTAQLEIMQGADNTIALLVSSLQAYLAGLAKLSDQDLVNYDFTPVGESLKKNQPALQKAGVSADDVDASLKIAKVATDGIVGRYREKVLRKVIIDYNKNFQNTTKALGKALTLLSLNIDADIELLKSRYIKFLANPNLPIEKKFEWRKEYSDELSNLEKKRVILEKQIDAVSALGLAHDSIAAELSKDSKLDSKTVIALLRQHSAEIRTIHSSFKQLLK